MSIARYSQSSTVRKSIPGHNELKPYVGNTGAVAEAAQTQGHPDSCTHKSTCPWALHLLCVVSTSADDLTLVLWSSCYSVAVVLVSSVSKVLFMGTW